MDIFNNSTFQLLGQGLHGASKQQKNIADNIANIDTPRYKAKKTHFKHTLNESLQNLNLQSHKTDDRHLDFGGSQKGVYTTVNQNTTFNHNLNNVDIDYEMAELSKNQIYYNGLIERMNGKLNSLQTAIRGGR
ncbi:flagellar basal body rod protein FlgB [Thalassorhabdus alkalitolerans]|uniref:Flagellar basal body rod protein FlgB n=1 Tax=Thalassorhabdus alkalitolerans TaxID=2282697 RepID=A0ABW0YNV6_9BACI